MPKICGLGDVDRTARSNIYAALFEKLVFWALGPFATVAAGLAVTASNRLPIQSDLGYPHADRSQLGSDVS